MADVVETNPRIITTTVVRQGVDFFFKQGGAVLVSVLAWLPSAESEKEVVTSGIRFGRGDSLI